MQTTKAVNIIIMRKGEESEMKIAERKRQARKLHLVLQCAGPGSVTGSRSDQCRREGRPHGGYKGLSSQYPLSRAGFDKHEYMEEVTNSVNDQYRKEQKCRTNSPQWLPAANKEKNHTGEQPLILQSYLAPNKQEQIDGVLPAPSPVAKRLSTSAGMYRDDPDYFCRGNSTHQYLTATEMPGQSERLVDLTLGRPTRTSLLRVRQRTKSAPGVRAVVEIKSHLHKQQYMAAKTEDRYKSVDVPQDLLPVTESHETVHQFLIGARYNRMYHHDAKCLNNLGLFVSRQDPLHCFKMNIPAKPNQYNTDNLQGSMSSLNLTESCESTGSDDSDVNDGEDLLSEYHQQPPLPKAAWSTSGQDDIIRIGSTTPAPSPSPASRSRETFAPKRNTSATWRRRRPKVKLIDGKALGSSHRGVEPDSGHDCCIMCQSQEPTKHYQCFTPGSHFARLRVGAGKDEDQEGDWNHNKDHMVVQQHHLRIMGIKYGVKSGPQAPPRNNLLYTTKKPPRMPELPTFKQHQNVKGISKNHSISKVAAPPAPQPLPPESQTVKLERTPSASSKISVRISTHDEAEEDGDVEVSPREDTLRSDALSTGEALAFRDSNNNPETSAATCQDKKDLECGEEAQDRITGDEATADNEEAADSPTDNPLKEPGISQDDASGAGEASEDRRMEHSEEYKPEALKTETKTDDSTASPDDALAGDAKDRNTSLDDPEGDNLQATRDLDKGTSGDAGDPAKETGDASADEDDRDNQDCPAGEENSRNNLTGNEGSPDAQISESAENQAETDLM